MTRLFRGIVLNPCSLARPYRAETISHECAKADVIALSGTQLKGGVDQTTIVLHEHHREFRFGWRPTSFVNKSCGGSVFISRKRFPRPLVRSRPRVPEASQGRVGAIRICGQEDLLLGFAYFPI